MGPIPKAAALHLGSSRSASRPAPSTAVPGTPTTERPDVPDGLDEQFPEPLTDDVVRAADVVITMGCGDTCPIYPGKKYEDWNISDPAAMDLEGVRTVRELLRTRVRNLASGLITMP